MRRPIVPHLLPQAIKNFLKLEYKHREDVTIDPGARIDEQNGKIVIGAGSRICHGAVIQGPAVIGSHCLIGNYAFIRAGTLISNNVRIGFSTEIKNALIEENVTIGPQCFISDSVIARDAYLGAQVRTSNHRLDGTTIHVQIEGEDINTHQEKLGCYIGARSKLGIQVIILPGRYILSDTIIGPRITVEKNLPAGSYRLQQQIIYNKGKE